MTAEPGTSARQLAWHYLQVDQPQRALQELSRLGGEDLEHPDVWQVRGWALIELDRYDEAGRVAADAVARWPENVELLRILAFAHAHAGRLAEAEAALLSALRLHADSALLLAQYADVLMRGVQLDKAEQVLELAERSDPDQVAVLRMRINLAYVRGRTREAKRLSEELLAYDAEDRQGQVMLGALDLQKGRVGPALTRLGSVVRNDPTDRGAVRAARSARVMTHPLAWPLLPFERFGVAGTWVAAIVLIFSLRAAGLDAAAGIATIAWIALCVYSWIAGPFLQRRMRRDL
jgi:predicted Zn-dependent protease